MGTRYAGRVLIAALLCIATLTPVRAQDGGAASEPPPGTTIHVVQRGETLFRIAIRYGTTVEAIARANGIQNVASIQVGQRLLVPNVSGAAPGVPTSYVVLPGDSLFQLALSFGTSVEAIAQHNRITNPARLFIGQRLALQEGSEGEAGLKSGWIHVVQPGDNLYRIATRYSVTIDRLMQLNRLKRPSTIFIGQRLAIPGPEDGPALTDLPLPLVRVDMAPATLEQGRTVRFHLVTLIPARLEGHFMEQTLTAFSDESRTQHTLLLGVNALTPPGLYALTLVATDDAGQQTTLARHIAVEDGGYPHESIALPENQLDLLSPDVSGPEEQAVLEIVTRFSPQRYFDGLMGLPCSAPVTSQFGARRSYNGGAFDRLHTGTDFAGMPGTAVHAPASGVVVFAGPLQVRGNATIIDHGWGVFTGYWHQRDIQVQVGQLVQQGQVIGTIGQTGRSTGPHLHWELFVGGVQVDPLQWVRQRFP